MILPNIETLQQHHECRGAVTRVSPPPSPTPLKKQILNIQSRVSLQPHPFLLSQNIESHDVAMH